MPLELFFTDFRDFLYWFSWNILTSIAAILLFKLFSGVASSNNPLIGQLI
jgi:hypothetical protein